MNTTGTQRLVRALLRLMAFQFNHRSSVRRWLETDDGWINFTIGLRTEDRGVSAGVTFADGRVTVLPEAPEDAETRH